MKDWLIKIETIVGGPDDRDLMEARVMSDLNDEEFHGYDLTVVDLQEVKTHYTGREVKDLEQSTSVVDAVDISEQLMYETPDHMSGEQTFPSTTHRPSYPPDAPSHPWDEGIWIFPDDHPLASIERAMHAHAAAGAPSDTLQIKKAVLELPAGDDG